MVGRREGGRCSPWECRGTGMCTMWGATTPDGGAQRPQILTEGGAREGQSRENRQTEGRVWWCDRDTPQKTPVHPFMGRARVSAGVGKPLSPPQAPQQPQTHPTLNLGCKSPGWQGSARTQCSLVPPTVWGPWGHIPAAGRGRVTPIFPCAAQTWSFLMEPTPFPCPGSSTRAGSCFP